MNGDLGGLFGLKGLTFINQNNLLNPAKSMFRQSSLRLKFPNGMLMKGLILLSFY